MRKLTASLAPSSARHGSQPLEWGRSQDEFGRATPASSLKICNRMDSARRAMPQLLAKLEMLEDSAPRKSWLPAMNSQTLVRNSSPATQKSPNFISRKQEND